MLKQFEVFDLNQYKLNEGWRIEFTPPASWHTGEIEQRSLPPDASPGRSAILLGFDSSRKKFYLEDTGEDDFQAFYRDKQVPSHERQYLRPRKGIIRLAIGFASLKIDTVKNTIQQEYAGYSVIADELQFYPRGKKKSILEKVKLDIEPGEFVAILGASGSGKSTLLRILGGMVVKYPSSKLLNAIASPSSRFTGRVNLSRYRGTQRLNRVAFVTQDNFLPEGLSVEEYLLYRIRQHDAERGDEKKTLERIRQHLRFLDLELKGTTPVEKLSGGEKRRLSVISEVLFRPALLLLDEPFTGLDLRALEVMHEYLGILRGQTTVVCTTHVLEKLDTFDRVIIIRQGTVVKDIRPQDKALFGEPQMLKRIREMM